MIDKPLLSIIIPVYNIEKYLFVCLKSIQDQDFKNFEAIVIDDGSTDNSLQIAKSFANNDSRFKIFTQKNIGQGITRNIGLEKTIGKYIMFADSDDYLCSTNAFSLAIDAIQRLNTDLLVFGYKKMYTNKYIKILKKHYDFLEKSPIHTIEEKKFLLFSKGFGEPWNKIYSKDFLLKNNIKFAETLKFEDVLFYFSCIVKAKSIGFLNEALFMYRKHPNSTMKTKHHLNIQLIKVYELIIEMLKQQNLFNKFEDVIIIKSLPALKKQFKKTPFKNKKEFFFAIQEFISKLDLKKLNNLQQKYLKIKKLKTNCFYEFLLRSYF